ncbi:hypothetical protein Enr10x_38090 [Gimesia panareensis]|uniref:DUF1559 domain-containing protein n=1 Tax=Gimesia panareensis TaxID=2527978 RepID=A0A517QA69_9PLAN|nr:DUF1559 domain-containing protein [Gimesia panareensis]QDT28465.1 hypothetical protein Enr10x_38090 [Gimesia panareensis]
MKCALYSIRHRSRLSLFLPAVVLICCLFSSLQLRAEDNETAIREPFRLDLVPEEALGVIAFRPAQLLAEPVIKPIRELLLKDQPHNFREGSLGLMPTDVKAVTMIFLFQEPGESGRTPFKNVFLIETIEKLNQAQMKQLFSKSPLVETEFQGKTLLTKGSNDGDTLVFLDEDSFLISDRSSGVKTIIDQLQNRDNRVWSKRLAPVATASVAGGINMQALRSRLGEALIQPLTQRIPAWPMIAPIWQNTEIATLGITLQKGLSLELLFEQNNNSEQLKQSLEGLLLLGKNMIRQFQTTREKLNRPLRPEEVSYLKRLEQVFTETQVTQDNSRVTFKSVFKQDLLSQMVDLTIPAILQARAAARRSVSKNNIKHIMLALHNYHDRYHHFPPAVVMGPDGKTPHSWRVELLPYLDQQALYDKYRMNEPWDSEHNLKIAETVVPVFSHPNSDKPANSCYFAVTGDGTAFGNKQGVSFKDITDGTSNTIAIVEAKRDIPWTKPEDIHFDGKKLPKFGGFSENPPVNGQPAIGVYYVGSCDGRARMIMDNIDEELLKTLLTIADGKPDQ